MGHEKTKQEKEKSRRSGRRRRTSISRAHGSERRQLPLPSLITTCPVSLEGRGRHAQSEILHNLTDTRKIPHGHIFVSFWVYKLSSFEKKNVLRNLNDFIKIYFDRF